MSEFWKENDELRELLAWRSAEAERPENGTFCLIILKNSAWPNVIQYVEGVLWNPEFITHWRPIGPLPEEGGVMNSLRGHLGESGIRDKITKDDAFDLVRLVCLWPDCANDDERLQIRRAIKEILDGHPVSVMSLIDGTWKHGK